MSLQTLAFREWKTLHSAGAEMIRAIEQYKRLTEAIRRAEAASGR